MVIALTWDLLIIIFVAVVITYSLIIGRGEATKVLVGSHLAALASQGIGMGLTETSARGDELLTTLGMSIGATTILTVKLLTFVLLLIGIAVYGGMTLDTDGEQSIVDTAVAGALGFATALFLLLTLFAIMGNLPLAHPNLPVASPLMPLMEQSVLASSVVSLQSFWLLLPTILLIGTSFI